MILYNKKIGYSRKMYFEHTSTTYIIYNIYFAPSEPPSISPTLQISYCRYRNIHLKRKGTLARLSFEHTAPCGKIASSELHVFPHYSSQMPKHLSKKIGYSRKAVVRTLITFRCITDVAFALFPHRKYQLKESQIQNTFQRLLRYLYSSQ